MKVTENCANCVSATLTAECTVNAAVAKSPTALRIFRDLGIDTCCGGGMRIADAATMARVSADVVIDALALAMQSPRSGDADAPSHACGCGGH